jgi:CRP/FNR family transcriptional regulator, anaerobic regulatory protein
MMELFKNLDFPLLDFLEVKTYPKGFTLLKQGKVCNHIYLIQSGSCRLFYYRQDKEVTSWFAFENETITSTSFFSRVSNDEILQTTEESTILQISHEKLQAVFKQYPQAERFARLNQEQIILQLDARLKGLQFQTAKERYEHLLTTFPQIMLRIPHHFVASYLGITPETLSRMRALR